MTLWSWPVYRRARRSSRSDRARARPHAPLAERGFRILALELGPHLAARARQNLASFADVEVLITSFEAWDPGSTCVDAVFACNSFHWVDPAVRLSKSAAVLRPDGHLIVLATPWVVPDHADRFWWEVQDDYAAIGSERLDPATQHPDRVADPGPWSRRPCSTNPRSTDTSSRSPSPLISTPSTSRPSRVSRSSRAPRGPS
jgi:SAM-dependent methyltransferase